MADTQPAPAPDVDQLDGGIEAATEAILGLLKPETETSETEEAAPEETEEVSEESEEDSLEASDEDDSEEDSEEPDESEEEDEEELLYAVKVDGAEQEVTLDELLKGYSRQSSYTKRTQQLAEDRKAFETAQQQMATEYDSIQQERQAYVNSLQQVIEGSVGNLEKYQSTDWERLKVEDPMEWTVKREEFREATEKVQAAQNQQAAAIQRARNDFQ